MCPASGCGVNAARSDTAGHYGNRRPAPNRTCALGVRRRVLVFPISSSRRSAHNLLVDLLHSPTSPPDPVPSGCADRYWSLVDPAAVQQHPGDTGHARSQSYRNQFSRFAFRKHPGEPRVPRAPATSGTDHRCRADHQQSPQITLSHLGGSAQNGLASGRVLFLGQTDPRRKTAPVLEHLRRRG